MKKRTFLLFLIASLTLTGTALADVDSTANFTRTKSYSGQFSDLSTASPFYANVTALYEYGLSVGRSDGTFGPGDAVNVGQVIIFAARIRSLYRTGDPEAGASVYRRDGMAVYQPYQFYLQGEGILGSELSGDAFRAATRAQAAHILANVLPASALPERNADAVAAARAGGYIADVTAATPYAQDILRLYTSGIVQGVNGTGTYSPSANISRGALAAMLTRLVNPGLRITLNWTLSGGYSAQGATWGNLVFGKRDYIAAPETSAEMGQDIVYMLSREEHELLLQYPDILSKNQENTLLQLALEHVRYFCEQGYNRVSCNYDIYQGTVKLTFSNEACSQEELAAYRTATLAAAIAVHDQLWSSGAITANMSEYERARVYFTWVCDHCSYDTTGALRHMPYSLFKLGTAICDGYTGAYNLLLKLEGIDCYALSTDDHTWTVATLDGVQYHIDTTLADRNTSIDYHYFGMSAAVSWQHHPWTTAP